MRIKNFFLKASFTILMICLALLLFVDAICAFWAWIITNSNWYLNAQGFVIFNGVKQFLRGLKSKKPILPICKKHTVSV